MITVRWRWLITGTLLLLLATLFTLPLVATAQDDVGFCLSCHVMADQGQSHATSFHFTRAETTCSDCHTGSLVQKYADGARHVAAQVTGWHGEVTLREAGRAVVAGQCAACHNPTSLHSRTKQKQDKNCLECHMGHNPRPIRLPGMQGTSQ